MHFPALSYLHPRHTARLASGVILAVIAILAILHAARVDLSFDGAMNMQAAKNRIALGRYAGSYQEVVDFFPGIQTGVPLLLPAELCLRALGTTTLAAQIPNVLYLVLLAVIASAAMRSLVPPAGTPWILLAVLATPFLFEYGLRGYGELPATFYVLLLAAALAARHESPKLTLRAAAVGGIALGMAVLTKTVMLIVVPPLVLTLLFDWAMTRNTSWRAILVLILCALAPLAAYEAWKWTALGAEGYHAWWDNQSGAIMTQAGIGGRMSDTPGLSAKVTTHLRILADITGMPVPWLVVFLCTPYAALAATALPPVLARRSPLPRNLALLAGTSLLYIIWWIAITPTARAWARRIMPGLLIHSLLAVATVVLVAHRLAAHMRRCGSQVRADASTIGLSMLLVAVAASLTLCAVTQLSQLRIPARPPDGRTDAARLADHIRDLPIEARVFGRGWWQCPVVAYHADRMFYDLDRIPLKTLNSLPSKYYVIDDYVRDIVPHMEQELLARSDYSSVAQAGPYELIELETVHRFPPFRPEEIDTPPMAMVDFRVGPYPYTRGLTQDESGFFWSRGITAILLDHSAQTRLKLKLWYPDLAGYDDRDLRITPFLDDIRLPDVAIEHDQTVNAEIVLPLHFHVARGPIALELHFNKSVYRPPGGGIHSFLYVVLAAGFDNE